MKTGKKINTDIIPPASEEEEIKLKKVTILFPIDTLAQLKNAGKRHHRSFNGELIFAAEQYLIYVQREANNLK